MSLILWPIKRPNAIAEAVSAKKGCNLTFIVKNTSRAMDITMHAMIYAELICVFLLLSSFTKPPEHLFVVALQRKMLLKKINNISCPGFYARQKKMSMIKNKYY